MDNKIRSLRMEHITKRFPGVLASDDISISVGEGEVLALVAHLVGDAVHFHFRFVMLCLVHSDIEIMIVNSDFKLIHKVLIVYFVKFLML